MHEGMSYCAAIGCPTTGGLVGWNINNCESNMDCNADDDVLVTNSYWDNDAYKNGNYSAGGEGKTKFEMMTPSTYTGWSMSMPWTDEETVWEIYPMSTCEALNPNCMGSYPYLSYQGGWNNETSSISHTRSRPSANASAPVVSVRGRTLSVKLSTSSIVGVENFQPLQIRMLDLRGKTVSSFSTANVSGGTFSLAKIPAGKYLVEVRRSGVRLGTSSIMVR
jgi:hypothetical protein